MSATLLESSGVSAFCGSIAIMLSAGVQTDEACHMLAEDREDTRFGGICAHLYRDVAAGKNLSEAMRASKAFPDFACDLTQIGEATGRLENVMRDLEAYYDEEDKIFQRIRASINYPAALLCIMCVILAFTVGWILPVFVNAYDSMSGSLTSGSFGSVQLSITIGWIAFGVTLACTIFVLAISFMTRSERGRERVIGMFERFPPTADALYQLALSRFTMALATNVATNVADEDALTKALATVTHPKLRASVEKAHTSMIDIDNPRSLAQALAEARVFEPLYARMVKLGARSGDLDAVPDSLSHTFFSDAVNQIDKAVDKVEPVLAACLTVAVAASLISVMLPLIGIMGSIG
ncbi:MAG: type II secretion system F family protein [Atopobiaceae bacterium]|nr:type II secretion system F family protein [Atopobiaceae bacterium]